jgi:hypothetical protein
MAATSILRTNSLPPMAVQPIVARVWAEGARR